MKNKKYEIIVSRYNEDVNWVKKYNNYIIYNKGYPIEDSYIQLENIGREPHTYLYHIIKNYNNLSNHTIFVQGNPFDHSPNFFNTVNQLILNNFNNDFYWISERIIEGDFTHKREPYTFPAFPNLGLAYEFVFGNKLKPETFTFGVGAQFSVSKHRVLSRPLEFYQKIFDFFDKEPQNNYNEIYLKLLRLPDNDLHSNIMSRKTPELSYHMERFWGIIFNEI